MSNIFITAILLVGVAAIGSNSLVLSPILTDVAADLDTTTVAVARSIATYGGATALSALFLGFLIDKLGPRTTLLGGGGCLALAMVGSALASSWITLAVAQAVAGLASGVMLPAIYAVATTTGSDEEGSRVLGRVLTGWSVSLIAGVPVSALIADRFGWEASFLALGGLVLASLAGFWMMPATRSEQDKGSAGGMRAALSIPGIAGLLLAQFFFMTAFYGTYAFLGDHLRETLGLSAGMAGSVVLAYGIGFGVAAVGDGIVDRIGPATILPYALVFVVGAYLAMPFLATWLIGAFAAAFVWGFANHFVLNVIVLRLSRVGGRQRGAVLGVNSAVTYCGALVGALVLGAFYSGLGFFGLAWAGAGSVALALVAVLVGGRQQRAS